MEMGRILQDAAMTDGVQDLQNGYPGNSKEDEEDQVAMGRYNTLPCGSIVEQDCQR